MIARLELKHEGPRIGRLSSSGPRRRAIVVVSSDLSSPSDNIWPPGDDARVFLTAILPDRRLVASVELQLLADRLPGSRPLLVPEEAIPARRRGSGGGRAADRGRFARSGRRIAIARLAFRDRSRRRRSSVRYAAAVAALLCVALAIAFRSGAAGDEQRIAATRRERSMLATTLDALERTAVPIGTAEGPARSGAEPGAFVSAAAVFLDPDDKLLSVELAGRRFSLVIASRRVPGAARRIATLAGITVENESVARFEESYRVTITGTIGEAW